MRRKKIQKERKVRGSNLGAQKRMIFSETRKTLVKGKKENKSGFGRKKNTVLSLATRKEKKKKKNKH